MVLSECVSGKEICVVRYILEVNFLLMRESMNIDLQYHILSLIYSAL